ncbi:hypothetical protein Nmel_012265, partial [Mimus melanotis]
TIRKNKSTNKQKKKTTKKNPKTQQQKPNQTKPKTNRILTILFNVVQNKKLVGDRTTS